jgi:hypothetical protein
MQRFRLCASFVQTQIDLYSIPLRFYWYSGELTNRHEPDFLRGKRQFDLRELPFFGLGRLDVLPVADLSVKTAIKKIYELRDLPDEKKIRKIAEP